MPITGLSCIVTSNEQVEVPHALVALQVTVVVPVTKVEPDVGVQLITGEVPVAVGSDQVAIALLHCEMFDGEETITGGVQTANSQYVP